MIDDHELRPELGNQLLAVEVLDRVNVDLLFGLISFCSFLCRAGLRVQQLKYPGNLFLMLLRSDRDEQPGTRIKSEACVGDAMIDDQKERAQNGSGGLAIRMLDRVPYDP